MDFYSSIVYIYINPIEYAVVQSPMLFWYKYVLWHSSGLPIQFSQLAQKPCLRNKQNQFFMTVNRLLLSVDSDKVMYYI